MGETGTQFRRFHQKTQADGSTKRAGQAGKTAIRRAFDHSKIQPFARPQLKAALLGHGQRAPEANP